MTSTPPKIVSGFLKRAEKGYSYETISSRSRNSSTTFIAVMVRVVLPIVSMKVRWVPVEFETSGVVVSKWTFLERALVLGPHQWMMSWD